MTSEVEQLVHEVTDLTGSAAPELFDRDAPVLRTDEAAGEGFYLVGLIGGKEVGKSALGLSVTMFSLRGAGGGG